MSQIGIQKTFDIGDGRTITIETGKLAKQADGSVVVKMGKTMLLATVVSAPEAKPGVDFMPLTVDYQEKFASTGRIPGSFFRREARLSDYEVLISRLVDRALRPLFPEDYHADTQVLIYLISGDTNFLPDCLAGFAASAALAVSDVPFNGPVSEVRVSRINGQFVINPNIDQMEQSDIDMIVAANENDILMVEGEMKEVSEADMLGAITFAHEAIKRQITAIKELAAMAGKGQTKREYSHETHDEALREAIKTATYDKVYAVAASGNPNKSERRDAFRAIFKEYWETLPEEERTADKEKLAKTYFHDVEYVAVRRAVLDEGKRLDAKQPTSARSGVKWITSLPHTAPLFSPAVKRSR
ncbi:MAG: polyribonucleotide nucleotidyltransferase [Bacteroidetes bacterium]|nr:MAG: polyribonucleotide nucleotidyltransferase [Bacteroidota bacterium]